MAWIKEEQATYSRVYRATHKEEAAASRRVHYREYQEKKTEILRIAHIKQEEEEFARIKAYFVARQEKFAAQSQRQRALKRNATTGPIDLAAIKVRDRMRCCICGRKINSALKYPHPDSLSFDHTQPLSLGGPHMQENLRVAHLRCNIQRGAGRLPVQMILV